MTETDTTHSDPEQLRAALVDIVKNRFGMIRTPQVEAAFRAVPRHLFLPGIDLTDAYAAQVVVTKRDENGTALSSASHPLVVAAMLEQLAVQPGHRVLEIGAGTGINAALLYELAGPDGHVTTIDIDPEVTEGARAGLAAAGYDDVEVVCADGADGHPAGAPYDRIIVTAGAWDLPAAWWRQLAAGGRIVVPLRLHGSDLTRSIAFDDHGACLVSDSVQVCGFVPLLGSTAHQGHSLRLSDDVTLRLPADSPDQDAIRNALHYPAYECWTGLTVSDDQPIEHLDLWLVTRVGNDFVRIFPNARARERGIDPARRWAGAAIREGGTIAYISRRDLSDGPAELGVTAFGPDDRIIAQRLMDQLRIWDRERPAEPHITASPAGTPDDEIPAGYRVDKPSARITIAW